MTRRYLRLLSRMLVAMLLYGQMAIAAYACPGQMSPAGMDPAAASIGATVGKPDSAATSSSNAQAGDCDGMLGTMDPSTSKLCADHCNYGHQSDQTPNLTVPAVLLSPLYVAPPMPLPSMPAQPTAELSALARGSPPLATLHCCFRI